MKFTPNYFLPYDGPGMAGRTWDEFLLPLIGLAITHVETEPD